MDDGNDGPQIVENACEFLIFRVDGGVASGRFKVDLGLRELGEKLVRSAFL